MSTVALIAIALSAILIVILCVGDPKRRRAAGRTGRNGPAQSPELRRILAAAACLPGLYCALTGDAAAFLIWLGGCGVIGWLLVLVLGARPEKSGT
ncbi:hypothetical protein BH10PSE12_BH10PSE12_36430 [soil metagenome]